MPKIPMRRRLADAHSFPGFRAGAINHGGLGDPQMRVVSRTPHKKTYCGTCGTMLRRFYDRMRRQVRDLSSAPFRILLDIEMRRI